MNVLFMPKAWHCQHGGYIRNFFHHGFLSLNRQELAGSIGIVVFRGLIRFVNGPEGLMEFPDSIRHQLVGIGL